MSLRFLAKPPSGGRQYLMSITTITATQGRGTTVLGERMIATG